MTRGPVAGGLARRGLEAVLDFLLPPACAGCGEHLGGPPREDGVPRPRICPRCRSRLAPPPHPRCPRCHAPLGTGLPAGRPCSECHDWPAVLRKTRSAVVLRPPADALVHALKYGGWRQLAPDMADPMIRLLRAEPEGGQRLPLVPVPTTPERLRARGYHQARELAIEVARASGGELVDALDRREGGGSQVALQREERRANVREAFRPRPEAAAGLRDRDVLLVDDVLTTGATACAAAETLAAAGAASVTLLTFARTLPG